MSAVVLSLADRQPQDVQRRAIAAVDRQRERNRQRWSLDALMASGEVERGIVAHASLDAWYRAQPVPKGRLGPVLRLSPDERSIYGVPASARLFNMRGLGAEVDGWSVIVAPVLGGYVVGVKAPNGTGVGVLWCKSHKASDYALRLSVEHGFPIRERYA